jgi:hypothetical protein
MTKHDTNEVNLCSSWQLHSRHVNGAAALTSVGFSALLPLTGCSPIGRRTAAEGGKRAERANR